MRVVVNANLSDIMTSGSEAAVNVRTLREEGGSELYTRHENWSSYT